MIIIKSKRKIIIVCLITVSFFVIISLNQKPKKVKPGEIDSKNITSFKLHNIEMRDKDISNESDRKDIINLINSVKITETGVEERAGIGYGVKIKYSNGAEFTASFLSETIAYLGDNDKAIWCKIDKDILDGLRHYYDKN